MSFLIELWGNGACFTRPEMKVERVSYDVPTPSAIRGIVESIYWHPGITWIVDRIYVLNPVLFKNITRNEVNKGISYSDMLAQQKRGTGNLHIDTSDSGNRTQRATTYLKDVHYVVDVHFLLNKDIAGADNSGKVSAIVDRRIATGACYSQPYFGTREFPAYFKRWNSNEPIPAINESRDFGFMLYDMDFISEKDIRPSYFKCVMKNGVIDLRDVEVRR